MFAFKNPEGPPQPSPEEPDDSPESPADVEAVTQDSEYTVPVVELMAASPETAVKVWAQEVDNDPEELKTVVRAKMSSLRDKITDLEQQKGNPKEPDGPELRQARNTKTGLNQALKAHLKQYGHE